MTAAPEPLTAARPARHARRSSLASSAERRVAGPWAPVLIAVITLAVFSPALLNGFVKWDDDVNLTDNPGYRGLGWRQLRWMLTTTLTGHYIPVSWLSFGLDYTLWGMNPVGYHATNVALHAVNAALFWAIARRLLVRATGCAAAPLAAGSAAAALFFALHPLRVESVAWATERRDVLSGLFLLATILLYLAAVDTSGSSRRWALAASAASYALALLSKSIVMTLPLLLLVLDVYPLARLSRRPGAWRDPEGRAVLAEKAPYLVLGLAGAATSYWAVASNHMLTPTSTYGWPARIAIAAYSVWFYVAKTALPVGLSPLHELPAVVDPLEPRFALSGLAAIAMGILLLAGARRWPGALTVWIGYLIALGPVTGLVHSGHQLTHDRYSYLSCLGWALLVGAGVVMLARAARTAALRPWLARLAGVLVAVWIAALAALTLQQIPAWRDTESLWRSAVDADPTCALCQVNLGDALHAKKLLDAARERFELALSLRPDDARAHIGLGLVALDRGEIEPAFEQLRIALERRPADPEVLTAAAFALLRQNRHAEAIPLLERAVGRDPGHFYARANLGAALADTGQPARALPHLKRAVELRPDAPGPRVSLIRAYLALGDGAAARAEEHELLGLERRLAWSIGPGVVIAVTRPAGPEARRYTER